MIPKVLRAGWILAVLTAGLGTMPAQVSDWAIDTPHSEADFSVKHFGIDTVHGSFRGVSGTIKFEAGNPAHWSVAATIDTSTVDTGVADRDKHLKSGDFLEVAKYPTMTFKSTSVKAAGSGYEVTGDLTLHGVTKPVTLSLEAPGNEHAGTDGKSVHRGFTATAKIKRKDFGLRWNGTLKSSDAVIGDEVKIKLEIEAVRQSL